MTTITPTDHFIAKSNYVQTTDVAAWKALCQKLEYQYLENAEGLCGFVAPDGYDDEFYDEGASEPTDTAQAFAALLEPGWVLVVHEIGVESQGTTEGYHYLSGYAFAVNADREVEAISLCDIYRKAKRLGVHITEVESW